MPEDPRPLSRSELAEFLPNPRAIRAFEKLFDLVPSDFTSIETYINESRLRVINTALDYTVLIGNYVILVDASSGPITVNLPDAELAVISYQSKVNVGISKIDTSPNTVTISGYGTQTVAGSATQTLLLDGEIINLTSDGNNWELSA